MPVIGRLDGQVDDVLISPVSKRRRDHQDPSSNTDETNDSQSESPAHAAARPFPLNTPPEVESSAATDELPVWLL
jgi:hypothetical protein